MEVNVYSRLEGISQRSETSTPSEERRVLDLALQAAGIVLDPVLGRISTRLVDSPGWLRVVATGNSRFL